MRLLNNIYELPPPFHYVFLGQLKKIISTLLLLFSYILLLHSQDCLHDTIPPEIICKQDYVYRSGSCGNETVFADEFVVSAIDNCSPVTITFDREGKMRWMELGWLPYPLNGLTAEISIFARDTSGNVSECIAKYKIVPRYLYKHFTCELQTDLYEENDKIQVKVRTNDNAIYKAYLLKDRGYSIDVEVKMDGFQSIQSIIVEAVDKPFVHDYITTYDQIQTLYDIIGLGKYHSQLNFICEDVDCDEEINLLDVYKSRQYLYGIIATDSCFGKPIAYFIDDNGNILGSEIPFLTIQTKNPVIAFNQIGNVSRNLPVSNTNIPNPITTISGSTLIWKTSQISCVKGNQYSVDFSLSDSISLFGLQCNFAFDTNLIIVDNFHTNFSSFQHIYPNDIQFDWMNASNPKFENDYPKATILFTAKSDFTLNEAFKPEQQSISNFAIQSDGIVRPLVTEFSIVNAADQEDKYEPWIKVSNTSSDHTVHILGNIALFNEAKLSIHNIYGQTIQNRKISTSDGQINESVQLSSSGIYFLVLNLPNKKQLIQSFVVVR